MKNEKITLSFIVITLIVAALAASRLLPHPFNFSPVAALALFGGARYSNKAAGFLIPLAAVWISDLFLNFAWYGRFVPFYDGALVTYAAFALIVLLGALGLKKFSAGRLLAVSLSASIIFFVVSNFGVWAFSKMYPLTGEGLLSCYVAALPFFRSTLAGDMVYSFVIFYGFALAAKNIPALRAARTI